MLLQNDIPQLNLNVFTRAIVPIHLSFIQNSNLQFVSSNDEL